MSNSNNFKSVDFYLIDELLSEEQKLIRESIRDFVNIEISPNIEKWFEENHFPLDIVKKWAVQVFLVQQYPENMEEVA
tara:strand:+ start:579 stop:812 length:234 start_codon:yes stop_codon:yes gene_type:complete